MPARSTILDPYDKTVTLVSGGQSHTYSYSTAISTARIADQLSPEMMSLIVNSLAGQARKSA